MVHKAMAEDSQGDSQISEPVGHGPGSTLYIGQNNPEFMELPITGTQIQFRMPYRPQPQQRPSVMVESKM